jgi:Tol biopolymer transport system component
MPSTVLRTSAGKPLLAGQRVIARFGWVGGCLGSALLALLAVAACGDGPTLLLGDSAPRRYRFNPPELLQELSDPAKTDNPSLTADLLEIYFTSERDGPFADIFVAERSDRSQPFSSIRRLMLNAPGVETSPAVSADGLTLWFGSDRPGGEGAVDVWVATRSSRSEPWSLPENVGVLNTSGNDLPRPPGDAERVMPMASDFGEELLTYRIQFAERDEVTSPFGAPVLRSELVFPDESTVDAFLTDDGLTLFYVTGPPFEPADLYVAGRRATSDPFEQSVPLAELNTASDERDPWLSPDGTELYFSSDRSGVYEIYVATVVPDDGPRDSGTTP